MIKKWEFTDATLNAFGRVLVSWLCAKVIDLDHVTVILLQKPHDVTSAVSVKCFSAFCGKTAGDDSIGNISHIQIEVIYLKTGLVRRYFFSDPVKVAAT
ncbi:MAG: hypothetical protein ACK521_09095 [bacterium]